MFFRFNINLTEEDYLAFSQFTSFESVLGKKQLTKSRIVFIALMAFMVVLLLILCRFTLPAIGFAIFVTLITLIYMLLLKKILTLNIKAQIKRMKKTGTLPCDFESVYEFNDESITETSSTARTEQSYRAIEKICVVKDRYILLYNSSISAYILPIQQIKAQSNADEFLRFISEKCNTVEYY